ncbi:MAG: DUF4097 family beta strand repeat-containing protein [Anaerolineae bacterium]|nr:DUF4097 family beta strand repeat-containing protein [Anaerolineae bacterium]
MSKEYYEQGKTAWVTVDSCAGNLLVKSWSDSRIAVQGEHEAEEKDGIWTLGSSGSLTVWLPAGTSLSIHSVQGDLVVKGVDGELQVDTVEGDFVVKMIGVAGATIEAVHGDLAVRSVDGPLQLGTIDGDVACRNVGSLRIDTVHGDLAARYVEGDAAVGEVMGDVSLHTVNGDVAIAHAHRDVNAGNLGGTVDVKQSDGDIRLRGSLSAGKHHLTARGDIVVRWPAKAPLRIHATASSFTNRLPLEEVEEQPGESNGRTSLTGRIGDGETVLNLDAGGRIVLKETGEADWETDFEAGWAGAAAGAAVDLGGLAEQISTEIGARMAEFGARMEERFGGDYAQRMAEKAARKAERAVARAARRMEQQQRRGYSWDVPPAPPASPPPPPKPRRQQPAAEEQVKILSMLEKGIISVEEAETLLSALES